MSQSEIASAHKCVYNLKLLAYMHNISTVLTLTVHGQFRIVHTFVVVDMVAVVKLKIVGGPICQSFRLF